MMTKIKVILISVAVAGAAFVILAALSLVAVQQASTYLSDQGKNPKVGDTVLAKTTQRK
ncbi:MAG: hypothetical protein HYX67_07005 [Candidatus Melainabacteria bacterium]|nr:hypothetical protein [Candidatus Melainabacteria bacterium]